MFLKIFNKAWEEERGIIESQLTAKLKEQINSMEETITSCRNGSEQHINLVKLRNELVLRKSLAIYESEEIARNRMQLRASYLAVLMSSVALVISVVTVLIKL